MSTLLKPTGKTISLPVYTDAHNNLYVECVIDQFEKVMMPVLLNGNRLIHIVTHTTKNESEYTILEGGTVSENGSRIWTGGHKSSRQLPTQKSKIPTGDEKIAAADCVD